MKNIFLITVCILGLIAGFLLVLHKCDEMKEREVVRVTTDTLRVVDTVFVERIDTVKIYYKPKVAEAEKIPTDLNSFGFLRVYEAEFDSTFILCDSTDLCDTIRSEIDVSFTQDPENLNEGIFDLVQSLELKTYDREVTDITTVTDSIFIETPADVSFLQTPAVEFALIMAAFLFGLFAGQ